MKFKKIIFLTLVSFLLTASFTFAADAPKIGQLSNPLGAKNLNDFFQGLIDVAIQLGAVIAGLSIMYGGFLYVTAQGDEEKLKKAQATLTWAMVGTAVLLGGRVLMEAIRGTIEQLK